MLTLKQIMEMSILKNDSLLCVPRPKPPIFNTSNAIYFAVYLDNVSNMLLKAQHAAGY